VRHDRGNLVPASRGIRRFVDTEFLRYKSGEASGFLPSRICALRLVLRALFDT
jgi:hypothetical protein